MRLRWKRQALVDLKSFRDWLSTIPDANVDRTIRRIVEAARSLERLGDIGRPGKFLDTRELSVKNAPYVIAYQKRADHFVIIAIYHTSQNR